MLLRYRNGYYVDLIVKEVVLHTGVPAKRSCITSLLQRTAHTLLNLDGSVYRSAPKIAKVFLWFYVRLGLVYNILKVGQIWSMTFVDLVIFHLHVEL